MKPPNVWANFFEKFENYGEKRVKEGDGGVSKGEKRGGEGLLRSGGSGESGGEFGTFLTVVMGVEVVL